ncbi:MAG: DUF3237 domain-containing protein [Alphaproteobacteria bacterium HGW-Alphaproteobacteria-18]|nr:MAG: DUF3237 domain-containing protein [Alphaproteobacteria bacterium HGW-Alphaproteobacteria-18]
MQPPQFRYLCTYRADLDDPQQTIGKAHFGRRMIAVLTGGLVEGDRLRGRVVPGGGDWATIDDQETLRLDARVTIETHDGALIYVSYRGVLRPMSKVREFSLRGGPATEEERAQVYFRTTPIFETGDERYAWLNNIVAVGLGESIGGAVRYNVFEVL